MYPDRFTLLLGSHIKHEFLPNVKEDMVFTTITKMYS